MLLQGLRAALPAADRRVDLRLRRGKIAEIGRGLAARRRERVLELGDHLVLPGLINAHDHLDLDLLPALGDPPYSSFYRWAEDIYHPERPPIRGVLEVPPALRFAWGAYRNLISGVTTVIHHGDLPRRPLRLPVRVLRRYGWSHSLGYSKDAAGDFRRSRPRPFFIHAGEGTDTRAAAEIEKLDAMAMLTPRTVLIHAMACRDKIGRLAETGTKIVWCPASNLRLYGATAPVDRLLGRVPVALGTDSTLSGSETLLDELRAAAATGLAGPQDLLAMVTATAGEIASLPDRGRLEEGQAADLLILEDDGRQPARQLLGAEPKGLQLILVAGKPGLATPSLAAALELGPASNEVDGEPRWLWGNLKNLRDQIAKSSQEKIDTPLWSRLT